MVIKKNNQNYTITDLQGKWKISTVYNNMPVEYEVSKKDCPTIADLEQYILTSEIF